MPPSRAPSSPACSPDPAGGPRAGGWLDTWLAPEFATWLLDAVLPQVRCPALILHGEADEYGSRVHPQRLQAGLGGAVEMGLQAGIRHVPHRQDEAGIVRRVRDFLA